MVYNYIKALHLIFVITWFAGLFYMPRLLIYYLEAAEKPKEVKEILQAQFTLMAKRLWFIITWPSAILAIFFALWLLFLMPSWLTQHWMLIKLGFVVLLVLYHFKTHQMFRQMQQGILPYSAYYMRIWNEGATLILFAIVFLVILKTTIHWVFGLVGLVGLSILLMLGIRLYKNWRQKNES
ncbi:MAG: CopD family protein [Flavobacteriaceae bacterium]